MRIARSIRILTAPVLASTALMLSATPVAATDGAGTCNLSASVLHTTDLSVQNAQDMVNHPDKYTYLPWCDPLSGVTLSADLDANGNRIIDSLEPKPAVTPAPAASEPTLTPKPAQAAAPAKTPAVSSPSPMASPSPTTSPSTSPTPSKSPGVKVAAAKIAAFPFWLSLLLLVIIIAGGFLIWKLRLRRNKNVS